MASFPDPLAIERFYQERSDKLEALYEKRIDQIQTLYDTKTAQAIADIRAGFERELNVYQRLAAFTSAILALLVAIGGVFGYNHIVDQIETNAILRAQAISNKLSDTMNEELNKRFTDDEVEKRVHAVVSALVTQNITDKISNSLTDAIYVRKGVPYAIENGPTHFHLNVSLAKANPVSRPGDLWLCGNRRNQHRILCGDATSPEVVSRVLGDRKPFLMITDPPYGIELDSEWRDRAGLNGCGPAEASYMKHRTEGHTETTISGDTRADWSDAFALVPSLQIAYVWHASIFTREVLNGLERIGFLYPLQIIWDKQRTVLTRTHYWFQHEPCWYVRKKNAPWFGKAGENSTIWACPSPKFIMSSSDEEKFDHPTQKPVDLMRRPLLNHTKRGESVYEPFLGSGTTLAAAEITERVCYGIELDPKYVDTVVTRWQNLTGGKATLEADGRTFEEVAEERRQASA